MPDDARDALQSVLGKGYTILNPVRQRADAQVFLARDLSLDRLVVITAIANASTDGHAQHAAFLKEARLTARLSHPGIVQTFTAEQRDGLAYCVTEYVDGETLREVVARKGALTVDQVTMIALDISAALGFAHEKNVSAVEITPDAIILLRENGHAMLSMTRLTAAETITETSNDIQGLGRTLHFALYGTATVDAIPSAAATGQDSPALTRVIRRCLSTDSGVRFADGEAVVAALGGEERIQRGPAPGIRAAREQVDHLSDVTAVLGGSVISICLAVFFEIVVLGENASEYMVSGLLLILFFSLPAFGSGLLQLLGAIRELRRSGHSSQEIVGGLGDSDEPAAGRDDRRWTRIAEAVVFFVAGAAGFGWAVKTGSDLWVQVVVILSALLLSATGGAILARGFLRSAFGRRWLNTRLHGRAGRWLVSLASLGLGRSKRSATMGASAPTEVIVGDAVQVLFAALPEGLRQTLAELPSLVDRLTTSAEALRRRDAQLARALAECGPLGIGTLGTVDSLESVRDHAALELEVARRENAERLRTTVRALELLRLDLLRLAAGASHPEAITANMAAAREIFEQVDRFVEIRD